MTQALGSRYDETSKHLFVKNIMYPKFTATARKRDISRYPLSLILYSTDVQVLLLHCRAQQREHLQEHPCGPH